MKRVQNLFKALSLVFLVCGISNVGLAANSRNVEESELSPDEELIFAVKGIKEGLVIVTTLFLGPIAGAFVAASPTYESSKDLLEIDAALKAGAEIDFQEKHSGYTALIYAAYNGYPKIAQHLIEKGANIEVKEKEGYNAYTMAKYYLERYNEKYRTNEETPFSEKFDEKNKENMRQHCQDYINRYSELIVILEPLTIDRSSPKASWF